MVSVGIEISGSNNLVSGNRVIGCDIGIQLIDVTDSSIHNNSITSKISGVKTSNSSRNTISYNRVSQIQENDFFEITLNDLIFFLIKYSDIENTKIINIYSNLGRALNEKVYK